MYGLGGGQRGSPGLHAEEGTGSLTWVPQHCGRPGGEGTARVQAAGKLPWSPSRPGML